MSLGWPPFFLFLQISEKRRSGLFLTLVELHVRVLTSFIKCNKFNKALTNFNEALTKPYHGLIELEIDFRYHSKRL